MNKGRLLLIIACFTLVHTQLAAPLDVRTLPLNPATKVSPTETSIKEIFAKQFNILAFAVGIYNLEIGEHLAKDAIKMRLSDGVAACNKNLEVFFDLDKIDFKKKGFTRYYPFSVNGRDFIIRIFDISEKHYLEDFEVISEGKFEKLNIGWQIIPGINSILEEKKPEKISVSDPVFYSTQP